MSLCAIVPIKPLRKGKSRLSDVLSKEKREKLNQFLLENTISQIRSVAEVDEIIVISYDPSALTIARKYETRTVLENKRTNINLALRKATMAALAFNATKVLIIPSDLPLLTSSDLNDLIQVSGIPPEIIITPDRKLFGTNALFINPINSLKYNFGDWSFKKHIEQAERLKINVHIFNNKNLAFDLDNPEDLEYLRTNLQNLDSRVIQTIKKEE